MAIDREADHTGRHALRFNGVGKSIRGRWIHRDLSFALPFGSILGVSGPNGVGKSMLLRLACGLVAATEGHIELDESIMGQRRTFPRDVGLAVDGPSYLSGASGIENLRELARIRGLLSDKDLIDVLASFDLPTDKQLKVSGYSLGMKQKLTLAQAFMESPRLLLLDEPFNALDEASVASLQSRLHQHRDAGGAAIVVSHDLAALTELADEVLRLDGPNKYRMLVG